MCNRRETTSDSVTPQLPTAQLAAPARTVGSRRGPHRTTLPPSAATLCCDTCAAPHSLPAHTPCARHISRQHPALGRVCPSHAVCVQQALSPDRAGLVPTRKSSPATWAVLAATHCASASAQCSGKQVCGRAAFHCPANQDTRARPIDAYFHPSRHLPMVLLQAHASHHTVHRRCRLACWHKLHPMQNKAPHQAVLSLHTT